MTIHSLKHTQKTVLGLSLLVLLSAATGACSINPVSKLPEVTLITVEQEKKIGEEESKKVEQEMGLLDDAAWDALVERVEARVNDAVAFADASPEPPAEWLTADVYA